MRLSDIEPQTISSLKREPEPSTLVILAAGAAVGIPLLYTSIVPNWAALAIGVTFGIGAAISLNRLQDKRELSNATTPPANMPEPPAFDISERFAVWEQLIALTQI